MRKQRTANPDWWGSVDEDFYVDPLSQITVRDILEVFDEMIDLQCSNGNYDFDPYMHGMANGMIYMRSLIDGGDPTFMEAPDVWLNDLPSEPCELELAPEEGGGFVPCDTVQEPDPELFLDEEYEEEKEYFTAKVEGRNLYHPPGMTLDQWEMEKRRRGSARQWVRNNSPDQSRGEARRTRNPFKTERRNPDPPGTVVDVIVETCGRNYHPEECREYTKGFKFAMAELEPFVVEAADPRQDREFRKEAERMFDMVKYALRNPGVQRQVMHIPHDMGLILPMSVLGEEEYNDVAVAFTAVNKSGKGSMATLQGHPLFNYGVQLDTLPSKFFSLSPRDALEALPYYLDKATWMHEFIHLLDAKRHEDPLMAAENRREPENMVEYVSSPQEFNAFYQERIHDIEEWLNKMRPAYLESTLDSFDSFFDFALERFNQVVPFFYKNIDEKYLRKLKQRLYQFYVDYKESYHAA